MSSRENPKTKSNNQCPVKWSANRIATKAKQQEIANEVREIIIEDLKIAVNAKREE